LGAQQNLVSIGRHGGFTSLLQRELCKSDIVLALHGLVQRMAWKLGLDQHFARSIAPPRTSRHLRELRIELLRHAEVRAVQGVVRIDHTHQRETRKVVSLGQHLRADQDVDLMVLHALAHVVEGERSACCVSVNTQYARSGKPLPEYLFNALCAMTCRRQIQVTAARTCPYPRLLVPA